MNNFVLAVACIGAVIAGFCAYSVAKNGKHYKACAAFILVVVLAVLVIINQMYICGESNPLFVTAWDAADALSFYGSFLAFVGTAVLGGVAILQNNRSHDAAEKANSLASQMMGIEKSKALPLVDFARLDGRHGYIKIEFATTNGVPEYPRIKMWMFNISDSMAKSVKISDVTVYNKNHKFVIDETVRSYNTARVLPKSSESNFAFLLKEIERTKDDEENISVVEFLSQDMTEPDGKFDSYKRYVIKIKVDLINCFDVHITECIEIHIRRMPCVGLEDAPGGKPTLQNDNDNWVFVEDTEIISHEINSLTTKEAE